ncbi:hypothetical protein KTQ54_06215 [Komagataeibacter oboediens]|uniref:hypothetical protein n=1 Tax=Komagataeibacter oboediens TaxID=65958 RepID=UPI001C2B8A98|nr:hypothetical protein [Komagataeibacter oboediens]MBV0888133.1 hypothetical protein [Komagataeibacter oboediens]MCK9820767.1 hypothetical protein [Komagataeibacter oboediens]
MPEPTKKVVKVPGRTLFNGKKKVPVGVPFDLPADEADHLIRLGHVRLYEPDLPPLKEDPDPDAPPAGGTEGA